MCTTCVPGPLRDQKVSDSLGLENPVESCELPCECWELNSGPLQGQEELSTAEPCLPSTGGKVIDVHSVT